MYLITAYFDDKTNAMLQHHIDTIAEATGNTYMTDNHVPPHITLAKRLDEGQLQKALEVMQAGFTPVTGLITEVGLSEVNPHKDVERIRLERSDDDLKHE